jgi:hypothetical protein
MTTAEPREIATMSNPRPIWVMDKKTRITAAQHAVSRAAAKVSEKVQYIRQLDEAIEELQVARDKLVQVLADEDD